MREDTSIARVLRRLNQANRERDEAQAEVVRLQQLIRDIPKARMDDDMRLDPMWIVEYAAWLKRAVGLDE